MNTNDSVFYQPIGIRVTLAQAELLNKLPAAPNPAKFAENMLAALRPQFTPSPDATVDVRCGSPLYVSVLQNSDANRATMKLLVECLERQHEHDTRRARTYQEAVVRGLVFPLKAYCIDFGVGKSYSSHQMVSVAGGASNVGKYLAGSGDCCSQPPEPEHKGPSTDEAPVWYRRLVGIFDGLAAKYRSNRSQFDHLTYPDGNPVENYGYLMANLFTQTSNELDSAGLLPRASGDKREMSAKTEAVTACSETESHKASGEVDASVIARVSDARASIIDRVAAAAARLANARRLWAAFGTDTTMSIDRAVEVAGSQQALSELLQDPRYVKERITLPILPDVVFELYVDDESAVVRVRLVKLDEVEIKDATQPEPTEKPYGELSLAERRARRLMNAYKLLAAFGSTTKMAVGQAVAAVGSEQELAALLQDSYTVRRGFLLPVLSGVVFELTIEDQGVVVRLVKLD